MKELRFTTKDLKPLADVGAKGIYSEWRDTYILLKDDRVIHIKNSAKYSDRCVMNYNIGHVVNEGWFYWNLETEYRNDYSYAGHCSVTYGRVDFRIGPYRYMQFSEIRGSGSRFGAIVQIFLYENEQECFGDKAPDIEWIH